MTNVALVSRKLAMLSEFAQRARSRRPGSVQALAANSELQDALSMAVLVAIQESIDIAFHVVADERWGAPSSYAEGFEALAKHGVISPPLAEAMTRAAGLRNRLAHGYASVDVPRLWTEVPQGLEALEEFARAVGAFVARSR